MSFWHKATLIQYNYEESLRFNYDYYLTEMY